MRAISFRGDGNRTRIGVHSVRPADVLWAWLVATILSGIPSTLHAYITGGDVMEATRAAAAMVGWSEAGLAQVLLAAGVVHSAVSFFWSVVLAFLLPSRWTVVWALGASAVIAVVDLRIIAPAYFPAVAALEFAPQFADHLMWGTCLGLTLELRRRARDKPRRLFR